MHREEILAEKAKEIQKQLEDWLLEEKVLNAGEEIIFSLRIEPSGSLVRRDPQDGSTGLAPIKISGQALASFKGQLVRPAQLSDDDLRELLRRVPSGRAYDQMHKLLVENGNRLTYVYGSVRGSVNKVLREPLSETHYRLMSGSQGANVFGSQLWEILPE
ncbi:MAG TPA: hypothetical protein PK609_00930 [Candidatus Paceibacterota bacterium]|nr:hypothetical protein [Candidatus Paceibacterota bacterium]